MLRKTFGVLERVDCVVLISPDEGISELGTLAAAVPNTSIDQETWLIKQAMPLMKYSGSYDRIGYVNKQQITSFADNFYKYKNIPRAVTGEELMDFSVLDVVYGK